MLKQVVVLNSLLSICCATFIQLLINNCLCLLYFQLGRLLWNVQQAILAHKVKNWLTSKHSHPNSSALIIQLWYYWRIKKLFLRPLVAPGVRIIYFLLLSHRFDVCLFVHQLFHSIVKCENNKINTNSIHDTIWISKGWFVKHKRNFQQ